MGVGPRLDTSSFDGGRRAAAVVAARGFAGIPDTPPPGAPPPPGPRPGALWRGVLAAGCRMVAAGALLGVVGALLATRLLRELLLGVVPADPVAFGGTALLVVASALLACAAPALRARMGAEAVARWGRPGSGPVRPASGR